MIDADDGTFVAGPSFPTVRRSSLDRHTFLNLLGKHTLTIGLVLCFEQIPAREAHDPRLHAIVLQLFSRFRTERNLGTTPDQDDVRRSAIGLNKNVATFCDTGV